MHAHTHTHTLSLSLSLTHTHTLACAYTHTHIHLHTHTFTCASAHTHSHTHSLPRTGACTHAYTHTGSSLPLSSPISFLSVCSIFAPHPVLILCMHTIPVLFVFVYFFTGWLVIIGVDGCGKRLREKEGREGLFVWMWGESDGESELCNAL